MNAENLNRKLIAAARADAPSDRVPYAFEQRIMARLRELPASDAWAYWSRMLWRATAPCLAITLAMAVWTIYRSDATAQPVPEPGGCRLCRGGMGHRLT
ncbi:MAG: hypothetical protein HC814_01690 [Rhodobacteraceae bacterium]|nr:hypothetical protein [Paracoccaceae bacterium]